MVSVELVFRPASNGTPTNPSCPTKPTSTDRPSLITFRSDARPLLMKYALLIGFPGSFRIVPRGRRTNSTARNTALHSLYGRPSRILFRSLQAAFADVAARF